jgi:hypothetical protein
MKAPKFEDFSGNFFTEDEVDVIEQEEQFAYLRFKRAVDGGFLAMELKPEEIATLENIAKWLKATYTASAIRDRIEASMEDYLHGDWEEEFEEVIEAYEEYGNGEAEEQVFSEIHAEFNKAHGNVQHNYFTRAVADVFPDLEWLL